MFNSTLDILYFTLAISAGLLSVVLAVFFIYLIGALSKLNKIFKKIAKIGELIVSMKKKLDHSASHLGLIAEAAKHIVLHFLEDKIEVKKKSRKSGNKKK